MARVQVGDVDVAYVVEGGPTGDGGAAPFVLVHGSTGGSAQWAQVAPGLAEHHPVVLPDYAGGTDTTDPGGPLELDDLAAQVLAAAEAAGAERFHLAGWSLGSVVATAVAAAAPERVRSLTLVCGWAKTDARLRFTMDLWQRLLAADPELFARYAFADGLTAAGFELLGEGVEDLVPVTVASLSPGSARHAELNTRIDIEDRLATITAPTLVVGGVEDRWITIDHSRSLAAAIPGARLVELDCGHLVPTERAAELVELLLAHATASA
jgi:pimeloyl-ACP methyl ester carboxylesterase